MNPNKANPQKMIEDLARLLKEHGDLSITEFDAIPDRKFGKTSYFKYFGSWKNAKREAGVEPYFKYFGSEKEKDKLAGFKVGSPLSPEDLMQMAKIDTSKWQEERTKINQWAIGAKHPVTGEILTRPLYQTIVWLKLREPEIFDSAIRELIKQIPKFKPKGPKRRLPQSEFALELALFDAHFGKLAWNKETEQGDYDLKTTEKWFTQAAEEILTHASNYPVSKIFFILGQDLMHVENYLYQTPLGGHKLDVDSRLPKIYSVAKMAVLKVLYMCQHVAPVEVLWVPGNHDMHASFYLSDVVKEHFRLEPWIEVDNKPPWRKARLWGNLLVGYTHDASRRQASIVNMLPQFWPELWGKSKYREWHTGHKHKKEEVKYAPTLTAGGVVIRQIPTMSVIDKWHYDEGFVDAVPAGEGFIWTKDHGICAHFTSHVGAGASSNS